MKTFSRIKSSGKVLLAAASACVVVACGSGSLNKSPDGYLTAAQVQTPTNLDGFVTAAYSWIGNDHYTDPNFFWPSGNIRAGDAHKGGNGPGDPPGWGCIAVDERDESAGELGGITALLAVHALPGRLGLGALRCVVVDG